MKKVVKSNMHDRIGVVAPMVRTKLVNNVGRWNHAKHEQVAWVSFDYTMPISLPLLVNVPFYHRIDCAVREGMEVKQDVGEVDPFHSISAGLD